MKDLVQKSKFISLRALGKSFESISKEVGVSKPTLIKWSKELEMDILNEKALYLDELREKYRIDMERRLNTLSIQLTKVTAELENRSFKEVPTDKLIKIYYDLQIDLEKELYVEIHEKKEFDFLGANKTQKRAI